MAAEDRREVLAVAGAPSSNSSSGSSPVAKAVKAAVQAAVVAQADVSARVETADLLDVRAALIAVDADVLAVEDLDSKQTQATLLSSLYLLSGGTSVPPF